MGAHDLPYSHLAFIFDYAMDQLNLLFICLVLRLLRRNIGLGYEHLDRLLQHDAPV